MQAFDVRVQVQDIVRVFDGGVVWLRVLGSSVGACARCGVGRRMTRPERVPLSLAQQRMWFLNAVRCLCRLCQQYSDRAMRLSGTVDIAALQCCGVGCCCAARSFADGVSRVRGCGVPAGFFRRIEFECWKYRRLLVSVRPMLLLKVLAFGSD